MPSDKGHTEYHESYFEHNCFVFDSHSKDVLETDIHGYGPRAKFKRWWFSWFLVSYDDERARKYFNSSHAMRMERFRHYRNYRNRIHPMSRFRIYRDIFMFLLFLINIVIFHHNTSIIFAQLLRQLYYFGAFSDFIIIADIVTNCYMGYIDSSVGKIVLDKEAGLLHYASNELFIHAASAIPIQCLIILKYGTQFDCILCKLNYFIVTLKVISVFRLVRLYVLSKYLSWERENLYITHFYKFLRICLLGLLTMMFFHDLCDTIISMKMISDGKLDNEAFVTRIIRSKFVFPNPVPNHIFFFLTLRRICWSFRLFSLNHRGSKYNLDILASLLAYVIMSLMFMWIVTECYDFISRMYIIDDRVIVIKKALDSMGRCRQLPDSITEKLHIYYDFNPSRMRVIESQNNIYRSLPESVKNETILSRHIRYFRRIPYFSNWSLDVVGKVVIMLKEEIYLTNDLVAEPWVQSEGLSIVSLGELAVYSNEMETGHLIDGDYFGELSLVTDKEKRTSRVVAITSCVMLLLEKSTFRLCMRQHPELFNALKKELLGATGYKKSFAER